ncbi:uncharacterized protein BYT42DRAFT_82434 [Radiomyces spectabilis]|uniref:uncharacterized protein n=1 Tax=Radiomyces spectabilis TaxID=64574 RepID=UPI00221E88A9|nr:uncharacterized protein BYT42DRAFT_82434 [Radiomyces spectabilis]KAI8371801.1 hypothetical protein BYT42DRAFT_82434 [Radiomyces spectabilis]
MTKYVITVFIASAPCVYFCHQHRTSMCANCYSRCHRRRNLKITNKQEWQYYKGIKKHDIKMVESGIQLEHR